jgi:hypothetical protein
MAMPSLKGKKNLLPADVLFISPKMKKCSPADGSLVFSSSEETFIT